MIALKLLAILLVDIVIYAACVIGLFLISPIVPVFACIPLGFIIGLGSIAFFSDWIMED